MKASVKIVFASLSILSLSVLTSSFQKDNEPYRLSFPYKHAGLTERQAAAHLLSRFTYGAKSGDVDALVKEGLEKWYQRQLDGDLSDKGLESMLEPYKDINLTNDEVQDKYPRQPKVLRMAIKDGVINKDSVGKGDPKVYRKQLQGYRESKGYGQEQDLLRQFINQKVLRATYTNNQLHELLTDFWFNHFNVSLTKNQCAAYVPAFERDVIRPNVTGKFSSLLMATAKSPAMLIYLDNYTSSGKPVANTDMDGMQMGMSGVKPRQLKTIEQRKQGGGLNENYAREVMELHTLGVDGGYTQSDVTQAARVLTGWTIAPLGEDGAYGAAYKKVIDRIGPANLAKNGFIKDGDFLFVPTRHDNEEKIVLGKKFAAGGGYQEGVELLNMLAHHSATAKFISQKLATRFVNDQPDPKLVDKMAKTFLSTDGDIKQVLITMVSAPEFWSVKSLREKTKSPFELAISAVRGLDAQVTQPYQLYNWINKMGQKMYYYQAPTGFPDRGQYWINTGALLNRMNFGLALAAQRIPGVKIDLLALNNNHEPESSEAALNTYSKLIMPERDLSKTLERLKPLLNDPELTMKVAKAAEKVPVPQPKVNTMMAGEKGMMPEAIPDSSAKRKSATTQKTNNNMLAQVVGVIIGSPEFQRK
ncbi:DUF1800 domain-containing protein [Pedobacter sp. JCM 36344]|uniref:DUF1800 domain-containing protein n=1 Tax=Pedobacter sp. JCM 36344 TaxID=3374280 RepID=UPI00397E1DE5